MSDDRDVRLSDATLCVVADIERYYGQARIVLGHDRRRVAHAYGITTGVGIFIAIGDGRHVLYDPRTGERRLMQPQSA